MPLDNVNFQTPVWCCEYMVSLIPEGCKKILEPTPGQGNIVNVLKDKGYEVISPHDFFSTNIFDWQIEKFDCIVMNPPFTPMKLGYEILYKCMEMSDNIIALMPWLSLINGEKRTKDIIEFGLKSVTHLPRKTFAGSRVQCCIMEMNKGYDGEVKLKFI